jgi:hypothetical protein
MTVELGIGLMLTEYCPFQCKHCMFSCSSKVPKTYMSDETIRKIACQWREIYWAIEHGAVYPGMNGVRDFYVDDINLIGGEPVADLDEFERCLRTAHEEFGAMTTFEMTTNGWWLSTNETAYRFMQIVAPYIDSNGTGDDFHVRISGTRYHDEFRPRWLKGEYRLNERLEQIFSGLDCPEEYQDAYLAPKPHPGDPWIYVGGDLETQHVVPVGRGADFGQASNTDRWYGDPQTICGPNSLIYDPQGNLRDICCRGSKACFGSADDNPWVLYMLGKAYIDQCKPNCYDCHKMAEEWQKQYLATPKEQLERQILMEVAYA